MLEIENVSKRFGGVVAINNVSIKVQKGEIHGLIGPNGAGKSTLFKLITKVIKADSGRITFNGSVITDLSCYQVSRLGIGYVFQESLLFPTMNLFDSMLVSGNTQVNNGLMSLVPFYQAKVEEELRSKIRDTLQLFGMEEKIGLLPSQLSYGDRRRALIARAIINGASLVLLDEPSGGMNAIERESLSKDILAMRKRGCTIFIVEHNLRLIMGICDVISVLNFGQLIRHGTPAEVGNDAAVIEAYIGRKND